MTLSRIGIRAGQQCPKAQTSLDKAFSMYDQLRPGTADGVASWDYFRVQLDQARTRLRYCLDANKPRP